MRTTVELSSLIAVVVALSACTSGPQASPASEQLPTVSVDEAQQQDLVAYFDPNEQAVLEAYADRERAQLTAVWDGQSYMDLYSEIEVTTRIQVGSSDPMTDIPPGTWGTITFSYTYIPAVEVDPSMHATRDAGIQELCQEQVFPAMRTAGVTGSLAAEYVYYVTGGFYGASGLRHTCLSP